MHSLGICRIFFRRPLHGERQRHETHYNHAHDEEYIQERKHVGLPIDDRFELRQRSVCRPRILPAVREHREVSIEEDISMGKVECPANSVPAEMRQTGMEGAWNATRQEANTGTDLECTAAN
jgi:hypothetical protein